MSNKPTYRDLIRDIAFDNHGFVTTAAAKEAGVPAVELPKLASRGGLEHVAYGLYRVGDVPSTRSDQFAEAVFRVGPGALLYGESVLALCGLTDENPRQIYVAVNRRTRPQLPPFIQLLHKPHLGSPQIYEGVPSQHVTDALIACIGRIENTRLVEAMKQARTEGYLSATQMARVNTAVTA